METVRSSTVASGYLDAVMTVEPQLLRHREPILGNGEFNVMVQRVALSKKRLLVAAVVAATAFGQAAKAPGRGWGASPR